RQAPVESGWPRRFRCSSLGYSEIRLLFAFCRFSIPVLLVFPGRLAPSPDNVHRFSRISEHGYPVAPPVVDVFVTWRPFSRPPASAVWGGYQGRALVFCRRTRLLAASVLPRAFSGQR